MRSCGTKVRGFEGCSKAVGLPSRLDSEAEGLPPRLDFEKLDGNIESNKRLWARTLGNAANMATRIEGMFLLLSNSVEML